MNSNAILSYCIILVGLLAGIWLMADSLTANTSAISNLIKWVGLALAVVCFVRPKVGVGIVIAEAFTTDYLKKIAVYHGNINMMTTMEVMSVVMLSLMACYAGRLAQIGKPDIKQLSLLEVMLYGAGAALALSYFALNINKGALGAGQAAFNSGVYLGIAGLVVGLFDWESLQKHWNLMVMFGLVWAVWGIKQVFVGFSPFEYYYAETGLSATMTNQFFLANFENPRPFGLGSGAPNYLCVGVLSCYCLFEVFFGKRKIVWIAVSLVFLLAVGTSQLKTMMVIAAMLPVVTLVFRSKIATGFAYFFGVSFVVWMIMSAVWLLEKLPQINTWVLDTFNLPGSMSLLTYSERLKGFVELTDPYNFSLFGGVEAWSHDMISTLYFKFGMVPMLFAGLLITFSLWKIHSAVFSIEDKKMRAFAAMFAAIFVFCSAAEVMVGFAYQAQPTPMIYGFALGSVFAVAASARQRVKETELAKPLAAEAPSFVGRGGAVPA